MDAVLWRQVLTLSLLLYACAREQTSSSNVGTQPRRNVTSPSNKPSADASSQNDQGRLTTYDDISQLNYYSTTPTIEREVLVVAPWSFRKQTTQVVAAAPAFQLPKADYIVSVHRPFTTQEPPTVY